ncbi:tyrosine-type recombinase/integrase [Aneurinibacillus sp. BA2021]|nr:tyrosine-type recombinase/integrase [Aneurinibacillus sp. BA2021]
MNYIELFQANLQENGKGIRTIAEYVAAVLTLEKWVEDRTGDEFNPDLITSRDLHDWVSFMQTVERLAPATINKRIAAIKVYWSYLVQNDYSTLDPTKKVKMKRISTLEQAPKWLSRSEQDRFLHAIEKEKNPWKKSRNVAIAQVMLQAGLRISEVASLNIQDIDLRRKTITVIAGKGAKNRIALMNPDLMKAMETWFEVRGEIDEKVLFPSERGHNRMTRQGVHYLIKKYLDSIGLVDYSAHSLRHSFCRNLVDAHQPLQVIAQLAGHESLETTRRYITPSESDLRRAVESISSEKKNRKN